MSHSRLHRLSAAFLLLAVTTASAQHMPTDGAFRLRAFEQHRKLTEASDYRSLTWRNAGPDIISGRCTEVAGIPGNRNLMYASFATGGFWKTTDAGENWTPLFDGQATQSIGCFALAPSNPDIIYLGTGEANIFRASLPGLGIYKSTDGGATWKHSGLTNTGTLARIVVHPSNPDIAYAAAGGHEWSYNPDRGVYRTIDGGKTWKKILGNDDHTGAIDIAMDPSDPNTLLASTWNRIRRRWSDPVPEDGDHVYRTRDGGDTWQVSDAGLPETKFTGRIGLAFSRSNPNIVYASVDNHTSKREPKPNELDPYGRPIQVIPYGVQVYRSNDKGGHWTRVSTEDDKLERFAGTYGWVFGQIRVDPKNEDVVYILGVPMARSKDGGKTFQVMRGEEKDSERTHGDHHALWIDPTDPDYLLNGNDGGVVVTYNGGKKWKNFFRKIPTTQFYNVTYDRRTPHRILGSVQDEGSYMSSSAFSYQRADNAEKGWVAAPGGEGTIIAVDPTNPEIVYASSFYGRLMRSDLRLPDSVRSKDIYPKKADGEEVHRGEWLAYTMISPHDPKTIYHGFQYLFRSTDGGNTWNRLTDDLTRNDKTRMGRTPYAINHQAITAIDESSQRQGLLYVGTDDGMVWHRDGEGGPWVRITKGLPQNANVSRLVASEYESATVYVTLSNRREDDNRPYIFRSRDMGITWESIAGNLPPAPVNVVREDPQRQGVLYCGTDLGVYVSKDGGKRWQSLQANLPATVSVQDLYVHPTENNLVIGTYGRGVWVLDDLLSVQR
jgi:photosystem II stability/assembly factor-like uncharacterized protein